MPDAYVAALELYIPIPTQSCGVSSMDPKGDCPVLRARDMQTPIVRAANRRLLNRRDPTTPT
jgi:hypothetical protein